MVDLLAYYSNRPTVLHDLMRAAQKLERLRGQEPVGQRRSVHCESRPTRRAPRPAVADRLSEADLEELAALFRSGMPKHVLAERYGISLSSVKRLLKAENA
jgi:hypothetical protein